MSQFRIDRGVRALAATLALLSVVAVARPARADTFRGWIGVRGGYFSGSSDLFTEFDRIGGGGFDLGIELVGITVFFEAIIMGAGQYVFTANLGADFFWGDGARFGLGFFTGPLLMLFPDSDVAEADLGLLTSAQQDALLQLTGASSLSQVQQVFEQYADDEQDLGRLTFGWNLLRIRISGDVPIGPLYLGAAAQVAYHLVISGEEVAAGAKNEAVNRYARDFMLPLSLSNSIRSAVGAEPVDQDNLDGFNWDIHAYLRLEF